MAAALLLSGCWYPKERGQRLEERMDRVEGESSIRPAGDDKAATQEQIRRLDARMAEVQGKLDALGATAQQAGTERSARQDKLAEELSRLRATLDAQAHRLDQLERAAAEPRTAAVAPPPERRGGGGTAAVKKREPVEPRQNAGPPPAPPERSEKMGVLALAREHESKGDKAVARAIYQEYVAKFPTDPSSARAHFRLGELAFAERQYRDAISEYGRVAKEFPRSDEAPEALLRTAESMLQLNLGEDAKAVLAEVPRRYPATPAAQRARERLAELNRAKR